MAVFNHGQKMVKLNKGKIPHYTSLPNVSQLIEIYIFLVKKSIHFR